MILIRNQIDFFLRARFKFEREISPEKPVCDSEKKFQTELFDFFKVLNLSEMIHPLQKYRAVDVGTKNFSLAPVIDQLFELKKSEVEIHGIELDAYRRLKDGYTRSDYARYFAKKARTAFFHPLNFLDFQLESDLIFLLNPFVSKEPLLAWGLPLKFLQPEKIFDHSFSLLHQRTGKLVLSHPSQEEFEMGREFAKKSGFKLGPARVWLPEAHSIQKKPRWGCLCVTQ